MINFDLSEQSDAPEQLPVSDDDNDAFDLIESNLDRVVATADDKIGAIVNEENLALHQKNLEEVIQLKVQVDEFLVSLPSNVSQLADAFAEEFKEQLSVAQKSGFALYQKLVKTTEELERSQTSKSSVDRVMYESTKRELATTQLKLQQEMDEINALRREQAAAQQQKDAELLQQQQKDVELQILQKELEELKVKHTRKPQIRDFVKAKDPLPKKYPKEYLEWLDDTIVKTLVENRPPVVPVGDAWSGGVFEFQRADQPEKFQIYDATVAVFGTVKQVLGEQKSRKSATKKFLKRFKGRNYKDIENELPVFDLKAASFEEWTDTVFIANAAKYVLYTLISKLIFKTVSFTSFAEGAPDSALPSQMALSTDVKLWLRQVQSEVIKGRLTFSPDISLRYDLRFFEDIRANERVVLRTVERQKAAVADKEQRARDREVQKAQDLLLKAQQKEERERLAAEREEKKRLAEEAKEQENAKLVKTVKDPLRSRIRKRWMQFTYVSLYYNPDITSAKDVVIPAETDPNYTSIVSGLNDMGYNITPNTKTSAKLLKDAFSFHIKDSYRQLWYILRDNSIKPYVDTSGGEPDAVSVSFDAVKAYIEYMSAKRFSKIQRKVERDRASPAASSSISTSSSPDSSPRITSSQSAIDLAIQKYVGADVGDEPDVELNIKPLPPLNPIDYSPIIDAAGWDEKEEPSLDDEELFAGPLPTVNNTSARKLRWDEDEDALREAVQRQCDAHTFETPNSKGGLWLPTPIKQTEYEPAVERGTEIRFGEKDTLALDVGIRSKYCRTPQTTVSINGGSFIRQPDSAFIMKCPTSVASMRSDSLRSYPTPFILGFGGMSNNMADYRDGEYAEILGRHLLESRGGIVRFSPNGDRAFVSLGESKDDVIQTNKDVADVEITDLDSDNHRLYFRTGLYRATPHIVAQGLPYTYGTLSPTVLNSIRYGLAQDSVFGELSLTIDHVDDRIILSVVCAINNTTRDAYNNLSSVSISHYPQRTQGDAKRLLYRKQARSYNMEASASSSSSSSAPVYAKSKNPKGFVQKLETSIRLPAMSTTFVPLNNFSFYQNRSLMSFRLFDNDESDYPEQVLLLDVSKEKTKRLDNLYDIHDCVYAPTNSAGVFNGTQRINGTMIPFEFSIDSPSAITSHASRTTSDSGSTYTQTIDIDYNSSIPMEVLVVISKSGLNKNNVTLKELSPEDGKGFTLEPVVEAGSYSTRFLDSPVGKSMIRLTSIPVVTFQTTTKRCYELTYTVPNQ